VFGGHTLIRHRARVEMSDSGIVLFGFRQVSLAWEALRSVQLNYYATKSDRAGGWMQLTLKGDGPRRAKIKVDSSLEGFDELVRRAAQEAAAKAITVSEATRANLEAMGVSLPEGRAA
jgi:hypothetical protein